MGGLRRNYWLVEHDEEGLHGIAEGGEWLAAAIAAQLAPQSWLTNWDPPHLELTGGEPGDYLETDVPLRLCSLRMRGLLDLFRMIGDRWQWLPVTVYSGSETWDYQGLHLLAAPTWLDAGHSRYTDGELSHPVVRHELVGDRRILVPRGDLYTWLVDDELCEELEKARTSGIAFYEVESV